MTNETEREHRQRIDQRPERAADMICEAISDAVGEALAQGQFADGPDSSLRPTNSPRLSRYCSPSMV